MRRAVTPIRKLRDGGVNICLGSNNIRNAFTPYGNGDLIQIAMLAVPVAHLGWGCRLADGFTDDHYQHGESVETS